MVVTAGQAAAGQIIGPYTAPDAFTYMGIGTGTTAAALGQTALVTPLGSRAVATISNVSTNVAGDTVLWVRAFAITTGTTVTEIGIFNAATAGTMLSRIVLDPPVTVPNNSVFVGQVKVVATDGGSL